MTTPARPGRLRSGVIAVAAAVAPFASMSNAFGAASTNLLARSRFTSYLNAAFKMSSTAGTWTATLVGIADLQPVLVTGDQNRFRLTFQTSAAGPAQQVCAFRRSGFTTTSLFVVPVDPTHRYYEAIINRTS